MMETAKAVKRGVGDDEDVDIGDEMPVHDFPPVEIDKDDDRNQGGGGGGGASSSSSSSGSSSSDSSSSSGISTYIVKLTPTCNWICFVMLLLLHCGRIEFNSYCMMLICRF